MVVPQEDSGPDLDNSPSGDQPSENAGRVGNCPRRALRSREEATAALAAVAVVLVSRILYHLAGLRWSGNLLLHAWQLLDVRLLEDDLFRSVWYLHTQPPLFNLFVGTIINISPFDDQATLAWVWQAMGIALCILLYELAREIGLGRWAAAAFSAVVCAGPGVVLYERWFQYEMPTMVLLVACAVAMAKWARHGNLSSLIACTSCATAVVLTRSLVHPVWLIGVLAVALAARPEGNRSRRLEILGAALVPVLLVAAVMLKNLVLFGEPQMSSWLGWNLHRIALSDVDPQARAGLIEIGVLDPISNRFVNQPLALYEDVLGPCDPKRSGVPALTDATKTPDPDYPADVAPDNNLNNECYLRVYDAFLDSTLRYIRARPRAYLRNVAAAAHLWALPTSDYLFLRHMVWEMEPAETIYRRFVLLTVTADPLIHHPAIESQLVCIDLPNGRRDCSIPGGRYRFSVTIVIGTILAALIGARSAWLLFARRRREYAVWVLVAGTIGWVTFASVTLELGENHRFRSIVEPLTLLVVVHAIHSAVMFARSRVRPR